MMKIKYLVAAILAALVITTSLITAYRSPRGSNDFDTYYNAGRAVIDKTPLYYTGEYHEDQGNIGPFLYPPVAACFLALFSPLPISAAAVLWNLFNLTIFFLCLRWVLEFSGGGWNELKGKWLEQKLPVKILSVALPVALLLDNLTMAQINIFIFFLAMASLAAWKKEKKLLAGFFLAASVLVKLTPLLFVFFFLFRKEWKVLAGTLLGGILLTVVIPAGIFGFETSRIYHRQWLGRTIKPMLVNYVPAWKNQEMHVKKRTAEEIANIQLANVLTVKNQSLQSALTRLCLKDRNGYAYSTAFPIYAARKYEKLPVLFPVEREHLQVLVRAVQAGLVLVLLFLTIKTSSHKKGLALLCILSLYFLSLPLLAPVARSHQFISWLFAAVSLLFLPAGRWRNLAWAGAAVYFLQGLPYGKAVGFGAWANLLLWISFAGFLFTSASKKKTSLAVT